MSRRGKWQSRMARRASGAALCLMAASGALRTHGRVAAQPSSGASSGEWRWYAGDNRNHHYSPQIGRAHV